MWEGPQTLLLEEKNACLCLNLLGSSMSPMAGKTYSGEMMPADFRNFLCLQTVLSMTFLPGLMKLINSVCHLVLDTSPLIFHGVEGREVSQCFEVSGDHWCNGDLCSCRGQQGVSLS